MGLRYDSSRYGCPRTPPVHDSLLRSVPADADRGVARGTAGRRLPGLARSDGTGAGDALSADPPRLPAGARRFPSGTGRRGRAAAASRSGRGCRRGRDRVRRIRRRTAGERAAGPRGFDGAIRTQGLADTDDHGLGRPAEADRRAPADREFDGGCLRHGGRTGPPAGRHDHARDRLVRSRYARARRHGRAFQKDARFSEDRPRRLAGVARGASADGCGGAAGRADRRRSRATATRQQRPGDRSRLDGVDAIDRQAARRHRQSSERRCRAAGPRYRSRRGVLGLDRRRQGHRSRPRSSAVRDAGFPARARRQARPGHAARDASFAWSRTCRLGSAAAGRGHRPLARYPEGQRVRSSQVGCAERALADCRRDHRGRGHGDLARTARSRGRWHTRQQGAHGRTDHARPRARPPRCCDPGTLESPGRRFRRRSSVRYRHRSFRAACCRSRAERMRAGHRAGAAQTSALPSRPA